MKKSKLISLSSILVLLIVMIVGTSCTAVESENASTGTESPSDEGVGQLEVVFMDVGQADSILIDLPDARKILIDGGNRADGERVVEGLKEAGVTELDLVVATHPHEDHIGGLPDVLRAFEADRIIMPDRMAETRIFEELLTTIDEKGMTVDVPKAGEWLIKETDVSLQVVSPDGTDHDETNDHSIVLHLVYKDRSFLFTGDAESEAERRILENGFEIKSDVLKIGHHGSRSSTSAHFLRSVNPSVAIISCGLDNDYGHPHDVTMKKLQKLRVYRTDSNGEIRVRTDGSTLTVNTDK